MASNNPNHHANNPNASNIPMATAIPIHDDDVIPTTAGSFATTATTTASGHKASSRQQQQQIPVPACNDRPTLDKEQLGQLQAQGFPLGLAKEMGATRAAYPLRFWVVDNSGSMQTSDGHEVKMMSNNQSIRVNPCTRWVELQGALQYHIELAQLLQATTIFRMLNPPGRTVGPQEFVVGQTEQQAATAMQIIQKATPRGVTPLTQHLQYIKQQVAAMQDVLRTKGQDAVIVLATDGLPSNHLGESSQAVLQEFLQELKAVQALPVWIVIRLCTDDEKVVNYYNSLDSELELPLEVIDDFFGEAQEIYEVNRWLTYGLPLHRCREMGYHHRIFDLLDERLLNKDELLEFVQLLFGKQDHAWPDPHVQWKEFCHQVESVVQNEAKQFNPKTYKMEPWIDVKQLRKCYGSGAGGVVGSFRLFKKKNQR